MKSTLSRLLITGLGSVAILHANRLDAGLYFTLGPNWNNFVFEPLEEEETPNYYGYGGRGSFGYSLGQIVDLGFYGHYTPGRLDIASLTQEDARLWHGGGELGLRLARAVYLGVRGGPALYRLAHKEEEAEISGQWTGTMIQGSMGLLLPITKISSWQASMDLGRASLKQSDASESTVRALTQISLTLSFVYNGQQTSAADTAIMNHWIRGFGD